jgi:hypothetical protein
MATTLMPLDPATSPQRAGRVLPISARLLPQEIIAARRARKVRGRVIVILLLVIALLGSWYAYVWNQARTAEDGLAGVNSEARIVQQRQSRFADVVNVQNETTAIGKQLATLLARDLRWATLLRTLRETGSAAEVKVTGVNGSLNPSGPGGNTGQANTAQGKLPRAGGPTTIGALTVTGTAPDKSSLAKYVDALGDLKVVANPYLTSAAEADGEVQFNLQVDITADALGGRFTPKTTTGGK